MTEAPVNGFDSRRSSSRTPLRRAKADHPQASVVSIECADPDNALEFDRSLKMGSGRAFAKRHFGCTAVEEGAQAHGPQMLPGEWVLFTLGPAGIARWDEALTCQSCPS